MHALKQLISLPIALGCNWGGHCDLLQMHQHVHGKIDWPYSSTRRFKRVDSNLGSITLG